MKIPDEAKRVISKGLLYLATSDGLKPNVTVTQSGVVTNLDEFLICDCEMTLAKDNILKNDCCAVIAHDPKNDIWYKIFGRAQYRNDKKYLDIAKERLAGESYKSKGIIVIKIDKIFEVK